VKRLTSLPYLATFLATSLAACLAPMTLALRGIRRLEI